MAATGLFCWCLASNIGPTEAGAKYSPNKMPNDIYGFLMEQNTYGPS